MPSPYLHRTPAHRRRPLGPAHPAARPAPRGPRCGLRRQGGCAPRPALGPGGEPEYPAASAAPAPRPIVRHPDRAWCGRCRRSEEHTSELQSRPHLVCRLLLEKKKNTTHTAQNHKKKKKSKKGHTKLIII